MNHRSRLAFATGALLLASAHVPAAAPEPFEFRLDPGKAEEICMRLDVGHVMWTAPKGQAAGVIGRWEMLGR